MSTAKASQYLVSLADPASRDPSVAGAKAATLAALAEAGFPIPPAWVLPANAFRYAVARLPNPTEAAVCSMPLPAVIEQALLRIADAADSITLAVRSSNVAEDLAGYSYAGQYETVLGVQGPESLVDAVRRCWASTFSPRTQAYRSEHGLAPAPMAVLVQHQVDAVAAGVAFTADAVTGDHDVTVVNAVRGLGDKLVSGAVTPEEWRVSEHSFERAGDGQPVLDACQAQAVARLAQDVEARFGEPQDIEWALDGERLWLLQARPVTGLPEPVIEPIPVQVEIPRGYWEREVTHAPRPHSPFNRILLDMQIRAARQFNQFGMLLDGVDFREIGGWQYVRVVPLGGKDRPPPPRWLLAVLARTVPAIRQRAQVAGAVIRDDRASQLVRRWHDEWRPRLVAKIAGLRETDRAALSDEEADSHLAEALQLYFHAGELKGVLHVASDVLPLYELATTCRDLLGWDDRHALDLLVGLSTASTEPARGLAELAKTAARQPGLRELLTAGVPAADDLTAAYPEFAAAFGAYLHEHGFRVLSYEVAEPTLAERPELLLSLLRDRLITETTSRDDGDRLSGARGHGLAEARRLLADRRSADRDRFEAALGRAETAYPVREDSGTLAFATFAVVRFAALEIGRRLAARGQIGHAEDVFFLEVPEARRALRDGGFSQHLVARRKAERAWVEAHPGPASYGAPPGPPPPLDALPAALRHITEAMLWTLDRMVALDASARRQASAHGLQGLPASAGRYTGPARVITGEHEFGKLCAGDVLVCPITSPVWSVLFPSVGALVTDTGGTLSHSAIIAREYRIPAVVATGNATELLHDGQAVTVDGGAGVVTVEQR